MPVEREEVIGFPEDEEIEWRQYFLDFRDRVWPMFEEQGFTFPQAIMMWRQEILISRVTDIINHFEQM